VTALPVGLAPAQILRPLQTLAFQNVDLRLQGPRPPI
jgi:hypothetical protein